MDPNNMNEEDISSEVIAGMDREFHDSPDRVIAVIGAAYLDSMLDQLLRKAFVDSPEDVERMLRPDGPLGSNGSRYQLCYCLGLITREQRDDLKIIAKIRNAFAHDFKTAHFDTDRIRDYCSALKQPQILAALPAQLFPAADAEVAKTYVEGITQTPREKYRMSVFSLFGSLLRRLAYVRRVTPGAWFSYDPDAARGPAAAHQSKA
jgi:DNA-binding MltR family transcriptional regulator